jgi:hypothetical protein
VEVGFGGFFIVWVGKFLYNFDKFIKIIKSRKYIVMRIIF